LGATASSPMPYGTVGANARSRNSVSSLSNKSLSSCSTSFGSDGASCPLSSVIENSSKSASVRRSSSAADAKASCVTSMTMASISSLPVLEVSLTNRKGGSSTTLCSETCSDSWSAYISTTCSASSSVRSGVSYRDTDTSLPSKEKDTSARSSTVAERSVAGVSYIWEVLSSWMVDKDGFLASMWPVPCSSLC